MTIPGTEIIDRPTLPAPQAPTDTGTWFAAGFAENGPANVAVECRSFKDFAAAFGGRVSYSPLSDSVEAFFREGGSRCYVARTVGPAPARASKTLQDGSSADTLTVTAKHYGDWGNGLNVTVIAGDAGGEFKLVITHDTDTSVSETSPSFATGALAAGWASQYVTVTDVLGSALDPAVVAAQSLAGGTDDHASATDASWQAALALFTRDLGPGQVSAPGRTTTQGHTDLLAHAASCNRHALLDSQDTATVATHTAEAALLRALPASGKGVLLAPWAVIPGTAPGTSRTIPYSGVQAGVIARGQAQGLDEGEAFAGPLKGRSAFATGLSQAAWTDAQRGTLNDAGVLVARLDPVYGVLAYGNRTLSDPAAKPLEVEASAARVIMAIKARGDAVAQRYAFAQIDGRRLKLGEFAGDLDGEACRPYYDAGALYGETAGDAYVVDVGPGVNTPATIAARELHAVIAARVSPNAERVVIEIASAPITQEL